MRLCGALSWAEEGLQSLSHEAIGGQQESNRLLQLDEAGLEDGPCVEEVFRGCAGTHV